MKRMSLLVLVLSLSMVLVGCGGGDTTPQQTKAFSGQFDIVIENGTKKYDPMELTVTGDHGTIEVTNNLDAEHGFVIREFGIKAAIPAGETRTFNVDSAAPGEYMVDCHLHSAHAEATLVVEAP